MKFCTSSVKYVVLYARYSSNNQREESIDAQLRAMEEFCQKKKWAIINRYIDRAISGTSSQRPAYQELLSDCKNGKFQAVVCHKLDRWNRDRMESALARRELRRYGITLVSVLENLSDSPESIMMESLLEGMAEYYSANLCREIKKGQKESALKCQHLGGKPLLGYSVDPITKKYVIEPREAEIVKIIFAKYLQGEGYKKIIQYLNANGYRTKSGKMFGNNSIYTILRNSKFIGEYTHGITVGKTPDGKRNRKQKNTDQIIRIAGGMPQIIPEDQFLKVQEMLEKNKKQSGIYKAKDLYLLSGIIVCGLCGKPYHGNSRKSSKGIRYVSYRCSHKAKVKGECKNREISSVILEEFVLHELERKLFNERTMGQLVKRLNEYQTRNHTAKNEDLKGLRQTLAEIKPQMDRLIDALTNGCTYGSIQQRLSELEAQKKVAEESAAEIEQGLANPVIDEKVLREILQTYRNFVRTRNLRAAKPFVHRYVEKVLVFPERVELVMKLRLSNAEKDGLVTANSEIDRDTIQTYRPKEKDVAAA